MATTRVMNTLHYMSEFCANCGLCSIVCPHGVFASGEDVAQLAHPEACIECGACERNCPTGAIDVDSGVGCAAAYIRAALFGGPPSCGCGGESGPDCC